tara:strand:- start:3217 stop:3438 length:222 start_codon:yes stop_codon:yes gene_type:complete
VLGGVGGGIFEEFELELDFRGTTLNAAAKAATITTVSIATRLQHSFFMMTTLAQIVKEKLRFVPKIYGVCPYV